MSNSINIAVLGLGYVGCVSAACLAELGHRVFGVDPDAHKVDSLLKAQAPFYEPGLEETIRNVVSNGRLTATTRLADVLGEADVAFVCVGTPTAPGLGGGQDLSYLLRVSEQIAATLRERSKPLIVAIRSTVFPGTCEEVVAPVFAAFPHVTVVSNPEFLREGSAMKDFREPSLVVVGGEKSAAVDTVASIYAPLGMEVARVGIRTAELIKMACNAFHAVKIAFANEVGSLAAQLGVNGQEVMATLAMDKKLNASAAYLKPGFAFGGSCLPKDLRALVHKSARLDLRIHAGKRVAQ
jgi:GDP-mannose 6-dehydrogenase